MNTQNDGLPTDQDTIQYVGLYRPSSEFSEKRTSKKAVFLMAFLLISLVGLILYFLPGVLQQEIYRPQVTTALYIFAVIAFLMGLYRFIETRQRRKKAERKQFVEDAMRLRRENYGEIKEARVLDTRSYNEIKDVPIDPYWNKGVNRYYERPADYFKPSPHNGNDTFTQRATFQDAYNQGSTKGKSFCIAYQDADGNITNRTITVKSVKREGHQIYIKAYCHLRKEDRTFIRDRIIGIIVDAETGEVLDKEALAPTPRKKRK